MRVVVDTNIIFSALYNLDSNAGRLLAHAVRYRVKLIGSEYIKKEIGHKLREKLDYSEEELEETIGALPIVWVEDERYSKEIGAAEKLIQHKRDVPVLALALYLKCGIVSGDEHFHKVSYRGFKCRGLKELLERIEKSD